MIALFAKSAYLLEAQRLAQDHHLKLVQSPPQQGLYLEYGDLLYLVDADTNECIAIDFLGGKHRHRRQSGGGELLLKALGVSTGASVKVVDATAGLGRDAFVVASYGVSVTLLEQSPMLILLLGHAIATGVALGDDVEKKVLNRMSLVSGNAIDYFTDHQADVVYLDPMFPPRKKSALVKKEMRILQKLLSPIGNDETQAKELFLAAHQAAIYRVVVKRPLKAPLLWEDKQPAFQIKGKSVRFDVYTKTALPKPHRT